MRDKLIELLKRADAVCDSKKQCEGCVGFGKGADCVNYHITDYLLANGVIVPPCKVGDKLYYIPFGKTVTECFVHAIEYEEKTIVIKCHMWDKERKGLLHKHLIYFDDNDFGKTVFPDPKEAKKALEERGKK